MTEVPTMTYDELVLEVEFVASSGTFIKIAGITGASISRTKQVAETAIPDGDDESVPHGIGLDTTSLGAAVSGTGVWALTRHHEMMQWFYEQIGPKLNCRLRNAKVEADGDTGDIYVESGPALLTSLTHERPDDKGRVTAGIELRFDGKPTLTEKS